MGHGFADLVPDVDSRSGSLYCQICDDLVWDPTLEELRVRKIGTGSFSGWFHGFDVILKSVLTITNLAILLRTQEKTRRTIH